MSDKIQLFEEQPIRTAWDEEKEECYIFYNLKNKVATGSSFCKEKSEEFIEKYGNGEYVCLLCHDIDISNI